MSAIAVASVLVVAVSVSSAALPAASSSAECDAAPAAEAQREADLLAPARAALADGRPERALELAQGAQRAGADRLQLVLLKATIYGQMQKTEKQRQMLQTALSLDETLCIPWLTLARIEQQRGLWQQAAKLLEEAITANSACHGAYVRLAALYEDNNQPLRGLRILEQGVANNPDDLDLLMTLGDTYRRQGLLQQAESTYGRIITQDEGQKQAVAHQHLGDMYAEVGQYADAFNCYVDAHESLGKTGKVAEASYTKIFCAADSAVAQALKSTWRLFTAYLEGESVAREEAYRALEKSAAELEHIQQFFEQVRPPASAKEIHAQRGLFYTVACETLVTAQVYVDTGDGGLLEAAQQRRAQADQEREQITELAASASD